MTQVSWSDPIHFADATPQSAALAGVALARAPFGISLTSSQPANFGTYVFVNPAYCKIIGYSFEQLKTLGFRDIVHPDDLADAVVGLRQLMTGEVAEIDTELRLRRSDGASITVRQHRTVVSDEAGAPLWTVTHSEDVSERKLSDAAATAARSAAEEALRESEARYRLLADYAPDMIVCTRRDRTRSYVSPGSYRLLGFAPEEITGVDFSALLHPEDRQRIQNEYARFLQHGGTEPRTYRMRRKDGDYVWVEARWLNSSALPDISGEENGVVVSVVRDISERKAAENRIASMACHDVLTGLANRVLLRERLDEAREFVERGGSAAVLLIDLDNFKGVNDTLGHDIGDELLQTVARRLLQCVRDVDTVARLGGDEFTVVLLGLGDPQDVAQRAQGIVDAVSRLYDIAGHQILIGASVGATISPQDGRLSDQLLKNADIALYAAKAAGRRTYRLFEPEMAERRQARLDTEGELRAALAAESFEVFYQPIVSARSTEVIGFEALVRWRHPQRGLVFPDAFVGIAEDTGMIVPLGEWILRGACRQAMQWPAGMRVSVNVSPIQFRSPQFVETVRRALADSGLPANRLELEITESVLLKENDGTMDVLESLQRLGVSISLDDFGTGYSSLVYVRRFRFDRIKIDRSFVADMLDRPESDAIVRAVVGIGAALSIPIVAEGVETQAQLLRLQAYGCPEVQGFLFSKAVPAAEVDALLASFPHAHRGPRTAESRVVHFREPRARRQVAG